MSRPLSKPAYDEEFAQDSERRNAEYIEVHEHSSTESMCKSPSEVEFRKRSSVWPPPFAVRMSHRARYISLKISSRKGLEVIIPAHRRRYNLGSLFEKHRHWIEQHLAARQQQLALPVLPQRIDLRAISQQWQVNYHTLDKTQVHIQEQPMSLTLCGNIADQQLCKAALANWLQKQARLHLIPMLQHVSKETGLSYAKTSIRLQASRWGSCTRQKNISLNAKLLLLPYPLVRYVLIHELCHTVHLNHSNQFWNLVSKFDQQQLQHRQEIVSLGRLLPAWIET